ncbi:unnamed protein product [Hydatigera taeniaeformis]|uniref:Uncharacterized protein n=1 Tax=Hydatigena taeniaeformis TaxID=6205 RepID=A0A0R3XDB3_HYDTA|nr:unnamed protein product [Hydatigera taeniaeformis]
MRAAATIARRAFHSADQVSKNPEEGGKIRTAISPALQKAACGGTAPSPDFIEVILGWQVRHSIRGCFHSWMGKREVRICGGRVGSNIVPCIKLVRERNLPMCAYCNNDKRSIIEYERKQERVWKGATRVWVVGGDAHLQLLWLIPYRIGAIPLVFCQFVMRSRGCLEEGGAYHLDKWCRREGKRSGTGQEKVDEEAAPPLLLSLLLPAYATTSAVMLESDCTPHSHLSMHSNTVNQPVKAFLPPHCLQKRDLGFRHLLYHSTRQMTVVMRVNACDAKPITTGCEIVNAAKNC